MLVLIVKNTCRYVHATLMKLLVVLLILAEQNVEQPTIVLLLVLMLHHHNHVVLPVSKTRSERSSAQLSASSRSNQCSRHCNKYTSSCSLNPEQRVSLSLRARLSKVEVVPRDMIDSCHLLAGHRRMSLDEQARTSTRASLGARVW